MSGQLPTSPVFNAMNFKDESNTLISISDSGRRFARKIDNQRWKFTCSYKLLTRAEFAPILAFITKQRGQKETFTVIPPKIKDAQGNPQKISWIVKATGSDYFYKDKKPPLLFEWAYLKRFNPFVLREIIYHSGITPKYYFDRVMEDVNNGDIKRKFIMELNKAGVQAIVKGMKELFKNK